MESEYETPEFQSRNNDPTDNVQIDFTDSQGRQRVLSFVATRPHWCEETVIYGDLFDVALEKVFDGEADPVPPGSSQEAELLRSFREWVVSTVQDVDRCRRIVLRQLHVGRLDAQLHRGIRLVWFLDALENRSKRYERTCTDHQT